MTSTRAEEFFRAVSRDDESQARNMLEEDPTLLDIYQKENTITHVAILKGSEKVLGALIELGAPLRKVGDENALPIHALVSLCKDVTLLQRMLERDPELLSATADLGATVLHYAAANLNTDAHVRFLLEKDVFDVNKQDEEGRSALHFAAMANQADGAKLLLEAGALVDLKDKSGHTPLFLAAFSGMTSSMKVLLEAGGCIDSEDDDEMTPFEQAVCSVAGPRVACAMLPYATKQQCATLAKGMKLCYELGTRLSLPSEEQEMYTQVFKNIARHMLSLIE